MFWPHKNTNETNDKRDKKISGKDIGCKQGKGQRDTVVKERKKLPDSKVYDDEAETQHKQAFCETNKTNEHDSYGIVYQMATDRMIVGEVVAYYDAHGRHDMPWRQPEDGAFDPYKIMVSEIMLQQTQVARVIPKYQEFLQAFPGVHELAGAPLSEVLKLWVGLGYNRRAKYLHEAAKVLAPKDGPWTYEDLVARKGIGPNTAAAVLVYSYDEPLLFVETNIRTVIIHHFFADRQAVTDVEVLSVLGRVNTVAFARSHPRQWYWALMDYGTYLKASAGNAGRRSSSHAKQSRFEGSNRQVRGRVIRALAMGPTSKRALQKQLLDPRFDTVLDALMREKLVKLSGNVLMLYNDNQDTK